MASFRASSADSTSASLWIAKGTAIEFNATIEAGGRPWRFARRCAARVSVAVLSCGRTVVRGGVSDRLADAAPAPILTGTTAGHFTKYRARRVRVDPRRNRPNSIPRQDGRWGFRSRSSIVGAQMIQRFATAGRG
eukprot:scaffold161254_cov32-Tisochrysis_lutea.AAC.2